MRRSQAFFDAAWNCTSVNRALIKIIGGQLWWLLIKVFLVDLPFSKINF